MSDDDLQKRWAERAQAWLRANRESEQPDTIGHDLVEELGPWASAGLIEVEPSSEAYFSLIEANYPISVNRLDWSKVGSHRVMRFRSPNAKQVSCNSLRERLGEFRGTLTSWLGDLGVSHDDAVVFVGDGSEIAIKMKANVFLDCFPILLEQPQHGYLVPEGGWWCLNYTMESELYLGESSKASATGWTDE